MSLEWVEIEREDCDYAIAASSDLISFVVLKPKDREHYLIIFIETKTKTPKFQMVSPTEIQAKLSCEEFVALADDLDADGFDWFVDEFIKLCAAPPVEPPKDK